MDNAIESNRSTGGPTKPGAPAKPWSSEEMLAAFLLRMLGVYFSVFAVVAIIGDVGRLVATWERWGWDDLLVWQATFMVGSLTELVIGVYLLLGGQWVFNRLLTPIVRNRTD